LFGEYIKGIPAALRRAPGFPGPAAFYEIPGENATPKRLTTITEKEKMLDPTNPNYVYRIGSNGPSLQYILQGKINDLKKFTNDYNKMILKKPFPRDKPPVIGPRPARPASPTQGPRPTSPTQGPRPASPTQGSTPGSPTQGSRPGSPTQGSTPGSPTQGSTPGSPTQGSRPGSPTQGSTPATPTQGSKSAPTKQLSPEENKVKQLVKKALTLVKPTQGSTPAKPTQGSTPAKPTQGSTPATQATPAKPIPIFKDVVQQKKVENLVKKALTKV
jgi:hypothetical protein